MSNEEKAKNGEIQNSIFELVKKLDSRSIDPTSLRKGDKKKE